MNTTITNYIAAYLLLGMLAVFASHTRARAQAVSDGRTPFIERLAFKTNAIEWLLTVSNLQVEFDLLPSEYNQHTVQLGAKYNWNTNGKFASYFQHLAACLEFRTSFIPYSAISYGHVSTNQNYYDGVVNLGLGLEYSF